MLLVENLIRFICLRHEVPLIDFLFIYFAIIFQNVYIYIYYRSCIGILCWCTNFYQFVFIWWHGYIDIGNIVPTKFQIYLCALEIGLFWAHVYYSLTVAFCVYFLVSLKLQIMILEEHFEKKKSYYEEHF